VWKSFKAKLDEYFDDNNPWSCAKSALERRKSFFKQSDKNLLCPIHHAVLNNNIFVLKKLVEDFHCGKHVWQSFSIQFDVFSVESSIILERYPFI
jgi:hypothetical protein